MIDNSDSLNVCPNLGQRFNSSGNGGSIFIYPDSTYIIHQVCFSVPDGESLSIDIRSGAVQSNASLGTGINAITENLNVDDLIIDADIDCCTSGSTVSGSVESALEDLFLSTTGTGWANMNNKWFEDCDPCGINDGSPWYGVTCSGIDIMKIELQDNNLVGTIPSSLKNITSLSELILINNNLSGPIPSEIGDLSDLTRLALGGNQLSGSIPSSLGNLSSLQFLYLQENQLDGVIPTQFSNLTNAVQILLYNNELTGPIPDLATLLNLQILEFYSNMLTGSIPNNLPSSIRVLRLHNNNLSGSIPESIGSFSSLSSLNLSNNNLSGCYDSNLQSLCIVTPPLQSPPIVFLENNPLLPSAGDFSKYCNNDYFGECSKWDCDGAFITINGLLPNDTLKMEKYIISDSMVASPNLNVIFQAKDSIVLVPGFNVMSNAMFKVVLDDCSN